MPFPRLWGVLIWTVMSLAYSLPGEESGDITAASDDGPMPRMQTIQDKTLVAWVCLADTAQQSGGVLTLESRDRFDSIVFAEREPGRWMAGSDLFRRTQPNQAANRTETARPDELVQIAISYAGRQVTLFRNGEVYASYTIEAPQTFGNGSQVLMGLRHAARSGDPAAHFAGTIEEARIYGQALDQEQIQALALNTPSTPLPLALWTFEDGRAVDEMGLFSEGDLFGGARIADGKLHLDGKEAYLMAQHDFPLDSPIHFRPALGVFGDPIPFYWEGEYHVFYLRGGHGPCNWLHIASTDLTHWRELPTALEVDGAPDGPDGGAMFTGCVMEHEGTFHAFYTGHNPANPEGAEFVRHATSPNLIAWTKDPSFNVAPDGLHYLSAQKRNWRDPYVFWNEEEGQFWMLLIGDPLDGEGHVQALLTSKDMRDWQCEPPLEGIGGQECPDLFRIDDTWYLIGGGEYSYAASPRGPYSKPPYAEIDRPGIYAGKRMFDGRRHVWSGWIWDGRELSDQSLKSWDDVSWGGTQCLPRELYPGPEGRLYCKPVEEAVGRFDQLVSSLAGGLDLGETTHGWLQEDSLLIARPTDAEAFCRFSAPANYLLDCTVRMEPNAELTLLLRLQDMPDAAYRLILRPAKQEVAIATPASEWTRQACPIDTSKPVHIQAFVTGTILECFVNDAYALTRRIYDYPDGDVGLLATGGRIEVMALTVKTLSTP